MLADIHTGSVLRLEWGQFSFVITPALDTAGETVMINDGLALPSTALLPADSGSTQSTGAAWLAALNPRLAPISVGAGNPDDNPAPVVL